MLTFEKIKAKTLDDMSGIEWNDIIMYCSITAMVIYTIIEAVK